MRNRSRASGTAGEAEASPLSWPAARALPRLEAPGRAAVGEGRPDAVPGAHLPDVRHLARERQRDLVAAPTETKFVHVAAVLAMQYS